MKFAALSHKLFWLTVLLFVPAVPLWATLYAGASRTIINPETLPENQLEVNALIVENNNQRIVFCAVDTGALDQKLVTAVIELLQVQGSDITWDQVMISATHTHTGAYAGLMQGPVQEMAFGAYNHDTLVAASELIAQTIMAATGALTPARVTPGTTEAPELARNRSYPGGFIDPTLSVLFVETTAGLPLAYLVNYAAHPTILSHGSGTKNEKAIKGRDFPYGIALGLREHVADPVLPVLFINGNLGNVAPVPPGGTTRMEQAELTGRALATRALAALEGGVADGNPSILCRAISAPMPVSLLENVAPTHAVLHEFWIGNSVFLSLPGEVCSQPGYALRQKAVACGAAHVFLCGLTNNYLGYHTDAGEWFGALYESEMSFYGPMMDRWLLENHLPDMDVPPINMYSALLANQIDAYELGYAEGLANMGAITQQWASESARLEELAPIVPMLVDLPQSIRAMLESLPVEDMGKIGKQYAAYFARQQLKPFYTDAHHAKLIGIADGCNLPVDAVLLLQFIKELPGVPSEYIPLLRSLEFKGMDFFTAYADFGAFPTCGTAPLTVRFMNLSNHGIGPVGSLLWDFGDGAGSVDPNPIHTFTEPGDYSVTLTVEIEDTKSVYVKTIESPIQVFPMMPVSTTSGVALATIVMFALGMCKAICLK